MDFKMVSKLRVGRKAEREAVAEIPSPGGNPLVAIVAAANDENDSTVKFSTEIVKPCLCDYSDAYILITRDIKVADAENNTLVAFKNCYQFMRSVIRLNDEQVEIADHLDLTMELYNMLSYSDNFSGTTGSLYHFKRPDQNRTNAGAIENININSTSFKYQSNLIKKQVANSVNVAADVDPVVTLVHIAWENMKITVHLKYLSNFFRALKLPMKYKIINRIKLDKKLYNNHC